MTTKFLNRYGESLNEIEYDNNQYALLNHTHNEYLPLSGGVMTGDIQFKTENQTTTPFRVRDSNSTYGHNVIIGGNGATLIGAGESIDALPNADSNVLKQEEVMYITADSSIKLFSNCNVIANRREIEINAAGCINIKGCSTASWVNGCKLGTGAISTNNTNFYSSLNGATKDGRWMIASYPDQGQYGTNDIYIAYISNSHMNAGTPNGADKKWTFDGDTGNLEIEGDLKINGSSVKAVIDFMNKYSSMLNIIGNNA